MNRRQVGAYICGLASVIFIVLGEMEISFPHIFAWHELLANPFPNLWKHALTIGIIQVVLGLLLQIPTFILDGQIARRLLETSMRLGLAALFIGASIFKILDPKAFAVLVAQYQFLPEFMVNGFALFLPQLELWVGLALLFTRYTRENALLLVAMLLAFIIALSWALWNDLGIVCGCFDPSVVRGAQDRNGAWVSLVRDLILFPPTIWLCLRPNRSLLGLWFGKKT